MFKEFFNFEMKHRWKQPMVYIFFIIYFLLVFAAVSSDNVSIGQNVNNLKKNAPFVIMMYTSVMGLFGLLTITAFMNTAALRDFNFKFNQILFSTPLDKFGYFFGKFLGAALMACIPFLGINLAFLIGPYMPWVDADRVGPLLINAHVNSFLLFIVPNVLLIGAITYALASWTRSSLMSFLGAIGLLVLYLFATDMIGDLENESLGIMADPLGFQSMMILTKYWTVGDKNSLVLPLGGLILLNRLLWMGVAFLILFISYSTFSFAEKKKKSKKAKAKDAKLKPVFGTTKALPVATINDGLGTRWLQFLNQMKVEFLGMVKSNAFIVVMFLGLFNMGSSLQFATEWGDQTTYPVTYNVINIIRGSLYLFLVGILMYFSGLLVWKERDAKINELYDTTPYPNWMPFIAKTISLIATTGLILLLAIVCGVVAQLLLGYSDLKLSVYFKSFFLLDLANFSMLIILAMFIQSIVNNKYLGYLVFLAVMVILAFAFPAWGLSHNLIIFGSTPNYTYSDMNGFGPYVGTLTWFNIYWLVFSGLLLIGGILFWVRGRTTGLKNRWAIFKQRFASDYRGVTLVFALLWLITGGFIYYNTNVVNEYQSRKTRLDKQADYERQFKQYKGIDQPRLISTKFKIDIFPEERDLFVEADLQVTNKTTQAIDTVFFTLPPNVKITGLELERASLVEENEELKFRKYLMNPPIQPGDTLSLNVKSELITKGIENEVSFTQLVQNGTFFNSTDVLPTIGYNENFEIGDKQERKKRDLPERPRMAKITDEAARKNTYISSDADWVTLETTISTSKDQIAIAPGSLVKEWEEGDRRYFYYDLETPALSFFSFISANYEVERDKWTSPKGKEVDVEVYYQKGHEYNVDKMVNSIKKSLTYYSKNFSPYAHKQARIIEFPRYAGFAQAFPGTMPYSESIGFIANLEDEDDIDMVFYVVAHEMAHQWWAHQVIGANMEGATVMSETMSQYSALMVMEKEYGKEKMKKFLKYEMDRYLRRRGAEALKEKPLLYVENQGYIHYRKGSVIMYALKEYIGEDSLNAALAAYIDSVAYQEPPYTTALEFMSFIDAATPDSLKYVLEDMFETITLFGNRAKEVNYKALDNGKYEVTLEVEAVKLRADSLGIETEIPINDWVEIGVYKQDPEKDDKDKLIYLKRERITQKENTFTIVVDEEPNKAGIDPNHILIDRVPNDNVKKAKKI